MSRRNLLIPIPVKTIILSPYSYAREWGNLITLRAGNNSASAHAVTLQLSFGKTTVRLE